MKYGIAEIRQWKITKLEKVLELDVAMIKATEDRVKDSGESQEGKGNS